MYAQIEALKEKKVESAHANFVKKEKEDNSILPHIDHQPESVFQRKLQSCNILGMLQRTVQLFSTMDSKKISLSGNYIVDNSNPEELFVKQGAQEPKPHNAFNKIRDAELFRNAYAVFKSRIKFRSEKEPRFYPRSFMALQEKRWQSDYNTLKGENDCGYYAGCLAHGVPTFYNSSAFDSMREKSSDLQSDEPQSGRAQESLPSVQETFFISPPKDVQLLGNSLNYHAATVVAIDGNDRVTNEANAAEERNFGHFEMYGTDEGQTFLDKNRSMFVLPDGIAPKVSVRAPLQKVSCTNEWTDVVK